MSRKMVLLTIIALIFAGIALQIPGGTGQALAQEEIPPEDTACMNCHEDRYYLYDRGNWY
jgi:cytochrome c553